MPNFFYTDPKGQKHLLTLSQVKALAERGIIKPDTPLKTDTGHKGLAVQISGLFPLTKTLTEKTLTEPISSEMAKPIGSPTTSYEVGSVNSRFVNSCTVNSRTITIIGICAISLVAIIGLAVLIASGGREREQAHREQATVSPVVDVTLLAPQEERIAISPQAALPQVEQPEKVIAEQPTPIPTPRTEPIQRPARQSVQEIFTEPQPAPEPMPAPAPTPTQLPPGWTPEKYQTLMYARENIPRLPGTLARAELRNIDNILIERVFFHKLFFSM